ncbi:F-box/kelch-repeat protein At3g23880-like [Bidens hawaiensis]|uniref:F-box/kelch-repeat protein At3g23880-like n=1 Tax=Bidens hawaiensis TaxID=980011 RepID=UPI0040490A03
MTSLGHRSTEIPLHESLMLEVIARLPVKSIIYWKCACKKWRDLISDPYFVQLQLFASRGSLLIYERNSDIKDGNPESLIWVDIIPHEADKYRLDFIKTLNSLHVKVMSYGTLQVGSVNGWICYAHPAGIFYLLNPVLKGNMFLPEPQLNLNMLSSGFGVSTVGEYKVIRICYRKLSNEPGYKIEIEVYTLGVNRWKRLGQTRYNLISLSQEVESGVFVNGHVYWIINRRIYDFDLNSETFLLIPSPLRPGKSQALDKVLGVVKGRLSWISWCGVRLEVWVMKEGSWCKEIAIEGGHANPCLKLLVTCKPSCVIDGSHGTSILIFHDHLRKKVVAYCLDTKKFLNLNLHGGCFEAIKGYRPSFVKLWNF